MYTVDQLLADAASHRTALTRRNSGDVQQAWDALNRYIYEVLEKKQTLNVSNFCKIGWKVEEGMHSKLTMRPHFNISEVFARSSRADSRSQTSAPIKSLALIEEFNFSKCALRFSAGLTKDLVFMGLRAIIAQLADVISSGQEVCIDLECGTLRAHERVVSFNFLADYYEREGLEAPHDAPKPSDYRPSRTYAEPSADALSLSLQGSKKLPSSGGSVKATSLGGFSDMHRWPQTSGTEATHDSYQVSSSGLSKEELTQRQALQRHIEDINKEASEVRKVQGLWDDHVQRCIDEEQKDLAWRHALAKDYQDGLKDQIREQEIRKAESRHHAIEQASVHSYPDFTKIPEVDVYDYLQRRRENIKEDLDQQVEIKKRQRAAQKQRDNELDGYQTEANKRLIEKERMEEHSKGAKAKQECKQSWSDSVRLNAARKAIVDYEKADPVTRATMTDMVSSLKSAMMEETQKSGASQTPRSSRYEKLSPKTPRQEKSSPKTHFTLGLELPQTPMTEEGPPSSRPATGSARRFPIGAAASLALTKQRMQERGML